VVFFAATAIAVYKKDLRIFDPSSPIAPAPRTSHMVCGCTRLPGAIAMAVAVFQFSNRIRARYLRVHRAFGYAYVISVLISAPLAVVVALQRSRSTVFALAASSTTDGG
jgi:hypothetical protein